MASEKTLEEIEAKLAELHEEKRLRLMQAKRKALRKQYMSEGSFRLVENRIKYMLGGMILTVWGKAKAVHTLEKTSLKDDQQQTIEKFAQHYENEISEEIKAIKSPEDQKFYGDTLNKILESSKKREEEEKRKREEAKNGKGDKVLQR